MRILFDQGTPAPLRNSLSNHEVATAFEQGWQTLQNGDLLDAAEAAGFDVIVTTDKNLRYQQNLPVETLQSSCCPQPIGEEFETTPISLQMRSRPS